jgi:hypothetical protein
MPKGTITRKRTHTRKTSKSRRGITPVMERDVSKKVITTDDESIFESHLTILVEMLGQRSIYRHLCQIYNVSVYPIEKRHCTEPWKPLSKYIKETGLQKFIFFCGYKKNGEIEATSTHYKLAVIDDDSKETIKGEIIDPYSLYQIKKSHGFCQMFAFFIATNNTKEFQDVKSFSSSQKEEKRNAYLMNMYHCLKKTIELIKTHPDLAEEMEEVFEDLKEEDPTQTRWGIGKNMTFRYFINDINEFQPKDIATYIDERF